MGKRGVPAELSSQLLEETLGSVRELVELTTLETFAIYESEAKRRLSRRDESDWPYLALALVRSCHIWTEDQDFFGSGVATWTTDLVEIYLQGAEKG